MATLFPITKFDAGAPDGKHYWLTPPDLMYTLNAEFVFDFDPCPYPKPDDFDGLRCEWGESNYVNPPFGSYIDPHDGKKKGPTAWAKKAIAEHRKGKRVVFVYPIDKWVLMLLTAGAKVRNLGDVRWHSIEDNQPGRGTGRHVACFILDPFDCAFDSSEPRPNVRYAPVRGRSGVENEPVRPNESGTKTGAFEKFESPSRDGAFPIVGNPNELSENTGENRGAFDCAFDSFPTQQRRGAR